MKYVIDRSTWRCGGPSTIGNFVKGKGVTKLLNEQGFMCCLGQCALQSGVDKSVLLNASSFDYIDQLVENFSIPTILGARPYVNNELSENAMGINDNGHITPENRERNLIELFKNNGHELEFINDYHK